MFNEATNENLPALQEEKKRTYWGKYYNSFWVGDYKVEFHGSSYLWQRRQNFHDRYKELNQTFYADVQYFRCPFSVKVYCFL